MHVLTPQSKGFADAKAGFHQDGQQQPVTRSASGIDNLLRLDASERLWCPLDLRRLQNAGLDHQMLAALAGIEAGRGLGEEARLAETRSSS